jgi:hypothetical protein
MAITFRHTAGFGRRMEYWLIGQMLREGLDVYVPVVDDFGIDAVIRKADNSFIEVQIKARSRNVIEGDDRCSRRSGMTSRARITISSFTRSA